PGEVRIAVAAEAGGGTHREFRGNRAALFEAVAADLHHGSPGRISFQDSPAPWPPASAARTARAARRHSGASGRGRSGHATAGARRARAACPGTATAEIGRAHV